MSVPSSNPSNKGDNSPIYRKFFVERWDSAKFKSLTKLQPSGQGLLINLETGIHSGKIPGLFRYGKAGLAENLGWKEKDFLKAFSELEKSGHAEADWDNKVVWLPHLIDDNLPASPNVVISWGKIWELIPECPLKNKAYEVLKARIDLMSPPYSFEFNRVISKPPLRHFS